MAGFGDNTTSYQRQGFIPTGGISIECGCVTEGGDTTFYVPTQFTECFCVITNSDGSSVVESIPDVSSGFIKATLRNTIVGSTVNYVAFGY
jgi:hypothetical protein